MKIRRSALAVLFAGGVFMSQLSGCGGGGSSSSGSSSTTLAGTAMAGPFLSGQACAYRVASGAKGALLGNCANLANSGFNIDIGSYTGDVLIEIAAGAIYDDEANPNDNTTGTTLTGAMRTLINVGTAGSTVNVALTPLTETAVRLAGATLDAATVQAAIAQLLVFLPTVNGLDLRSTVPLLTTDLGLAYREMLRALSQLQWVAGGNAAFAGGLDAYLTALIGQIGSTGNTVGADLLAQLGSGLNGNCTVTNGTLACAASNSGSSSSGVTCDTTLFVPGAVHTPTANELATFARTYTGSEGSFDDNFNFVASGAANLVFNANGSATYNSTAYTPTSHCLENLNGGGQQLVIHAGNSHFDLRTDGGWNGVAPNGGIVNDTPYGGGSNSFGTLSITGTAVGQLGATVPGSFTPTAQATHPTTYFSWSLGSGASTWYLALGGDVATSTADFGSWQLQAALSGLTTQGVAFDMPNGSITFTNVTLNSFGASSGQMILNGTLTVPAATGTAVAITGTGTNAAGTGFDAPAATVTSAVIGSTTKDTYVWDSGKGITIAIEHYSTGTNTITVTNKAGPSWRNLSAGDAVGIDTPGKTVTINAAALTGISPTTTAVILNGSLSLP